MERNQSSSFSNISSLVMRMKTLQSSSTRMRTWLSIPSHRSAVCRRRGRSCGSSTSGTTWMPRPSSWLATRLTWLVTASSPQTMVAPWRRRRAASTSRPPRASTTTWMSCWSASCPRFASSSLRWRERCRRESPSAWLPPWGLQK